jgi:hypothetical protein
MPNTPRRRRRRRTLVGNQRIIRRRRTVVKSRSSDPLSGFEFSSPRNSRREGNIYRRASKKKRSTKRKRRRKTKTKRKQRGGALFHKKTAKQILDEFSEEKHLTKMTQLKNFLTRVSKPFLRIGEIFSGSLSALLTVNLATGLYGASLCTPLAAISGLAGLTVALGTLIHHNDERIQRIKNSAELITMSINELFKEEPCYLLLNLLSSQTIVEELKRNGYNHVDEFALEEHYYKLMENKYNQLRKTFPREVLDFKRSMVFRRFEASIKLQIQLDENSGKIEDLLRSRGHLKEANEFNSSISSISTELKNPSLTQHLSLSQYDTDQAFAVFHPEEMRVLAQPQMQVPIATEVSSENLSTTAHDYTNDI